MSDLKAMSAKELVTESLNVQFDCGEFDVLFTLDNASSAKYHLLVQKADQLRVELLRRLDLGERAMLALESLTPGGSEYVGDPDECVKFVRGSRQQQHEANLKLAKRLKEAKPEEEAEKGGCGCVNFC